MAAGLEFTAVPAVDGFGSPQVSWVVSDGETRLIHCGDTLWHGYWWQIAERFGPFDLAFLPINAAVAEFEYLQPPSELPAVLTPEQAAGAGHVLGREGRPDPLRHLPSAAHLQRLPQRRGGVRLGVSAQRRLRTSAARPENRTSHP